jgi:diguanylate cyclase (GGDEF)-like protein
MPAKDQTSRAVRWTGWLVAAMAATMAVYAIDVVFGALPSTASELFQKFASCGLFFGAATLCEMKGRVSGDERSAWRLIGVAMALWGLGSMYFSAFLWNAAEVPVPSIADFFWLIFFLPAYAGLFKLMRTRARSDRKGVWLDALVGGLGVGGAGAALVLEVVLDSTEGTVVETATNLAYPLGDLGLLALVVAAMTVTGWKASGAWRWMAAAVALYTVVDGIYLVQVAQGVYVTGGLVDLGWPAAAVLVGFAAWRTEAPIVQGTRPGAAILVPAVSGLVALALLVLDHFRPTNSFALGLAAASILVILCRLYLTVRENVRMLVQSRIEASTDSLTGLGNRRHLAADLSAQVADLDPARPVMLTLFDMDGFKLYNDTFGHMAGDQLLVRLSGRLAEVLDGRGTAYRMGGDEFCALWNLADVDEASVAAMEAVAAFSEEGEGFSVACSYGSSLLPTETSDPSEALHLADQRMYARKGRGRASAGRQSADVLLTALTERDSKLGVHMDDVADLATGTALRLGVTEQDTDAARQTALLHDVGKVAIPDAILRKPGPLTPSEWAFMKRHTVVGERIISAAPSLARVAKFVRSTHERFDGDGYPDGLAGARIPLISRIVCVCDAYDAMVTKRAYRDARDSTAAVAELRRCSGSQFDPAVVEAFVGVLEAAGTHAGAEVAVGASSRASALATVARDPGLI